MYLIKPVDKKSVILTRVLERDGLSVTVEEHYRWASGYVKTKPRKAVKTVVCREYEDCDDLVMSAYVFQGKWTEEMKNVFEDHHIDYKLEQEGWYDAEVYLTIIGPFTAQKVIKK